MTIRQFRGIRHRGIYQAEQFVDGRQPPTLSISYVFLYASTPSADPICFIIWDGDYLITI
jgi:hypothetical protein